MPKLNKKLPPLKDFINKPYILSHSENYEKFLIELGVRKNTRNQAVNSKPTVVLSLLNDNKYLLDTIYPEGRRVKVKFEIGGEIERQQYNGRPTTSIFHVDGNKLIEEQCSCGRKVLIEREFTKDNLTVMMEVNDVRCHRFYVAKASDHSFDTDTSRRFSIRVEASEEEDQSRVITKSKIPLTEESYIENNICFEQ